MFVSSQRRHRRVVGWLPVPKARPGSSAMLIAVGIGGFMPGRHDPQAVADADGIELGLGEAHPVAFFQFIDAMFGKGAKAEFGATGLQDARNVGIALEQRIHEIVLPYRGSGFAGFAEDRLLVRCVGIGIQHVHRQCAVCQ